MKWSTATRRVQMRRELCTEAAPVDKPTTLKSLGSCIHARSPRVSGVRKKINSRFLRSEEDDKQLLPGIPDEITLDKITPKLSWKTFHILSSVSRGWNEAIRKRRVYDARVRSHSTQTLVLINHFSFPSGRMLGLYAMQDNSFFQLPVIPHLECGIPRSSHCISLDGKIYVLGGMQDGTSDYYSDEVYMMDLARQGQWKQCAKMKHARRNFGCGVLHGRIYVCGGSSDKSPALVPEVYDPKLDVWSPIKSMKSMRKNHEVTALGDELFVQGGQIYNPDYFDRTQSPDSGESGNCPAKGDYILYGQFSELYNPARNEWRMIGRIGSYNNVLFVAEGKIHSMDMRDIHVYDIDRNCWAHRHSFSLPAIECEFGRLEPWTTLAVDNELVTVLTRLTYNGKTARQYLLHSIGFGTRETEIIWRKGECSFKTGYNYCMCTIQL